MEEHAPMRIALLVHRFVPNAGGLEAWSHDVAVALTARGHSVRVLTTEASVRPAGVGIHLVPGAEQQMPMPTAEQPMALARAFATAAAGMTDHIVHDTGVGLGADLFQPHMGCRTLNLAREVAEQSVPRRLRFAVSPGFRRFAREIAALEQAQLANAGRIIAISRETLAIFRDRYGVAEARLRVIPNGIDTARFHPDTTQRLRVASRARLGIAPGTLVLLSAARNFRLKGVQHSIAALSRLAPRCRDMLLLVAGAGPVAEFTALAQRAGVAQQVRFLGAVAEMPALFAAADVFVHPTAHDSGSLATLEALACGLPVVTTQRDGAADGMTDGREGFVLHAPDAALLAERLLLLRDPTRRAAMGAAARLLAERHDFTATLEQLLEAYADLPRRRVCCPPQ